MTTKAERIKGELLALKKSSNDGMLHAERVVSWARSHRKSALFTEFEWDNAKAADSYRLWQARRLIQLTIVTADGGPQLVSLTTDRVKGGGYREIVDVAKHPTLATVMLHDAIKELERAQVRFGRVQELARVWKELERVKAKAAATNGRDRAKAAA